LTVNFVSLYTPAGNSPVDLPGIEQGNHYLRVIPLGCGRRFTSLPLTLNVPAMELGNIS